MSKITYEDKEQLNTNENIPAKNKCMASDLNEIKEVVNENDTNALYNTNVKTTKTDSDTDVYSCSYINESIKDKYTTDEQIVGTYLGKPLYKKTIYQTLPTGYGDNEFTIENAVIRFYEGLVQSRYAFWWSIPSYLTNETNYHNTAQFKNNRSTIDVRCQSYYDTSCFIDLTLYYTKTTD